MLSAVISFFLFLFILAAFEPKRFGGLLVGALRYYTFVALLVIFFMFLCIFQGGIKLVDSSLEEAREFYDSLEEIGEDEFIEKIDTGESED